MERCTALVRRRRLFLFWERRPNSARVVDLSAQGVGFYAKRALRPGNVIRVAFDMPSDVYAVPPGVEITAEVRWVNPSQDEPGSFRVGCAFRLLTPEQQDLITGIIQSGDRQR